MVRFPRPAWLVAALTIIPCCAAAVSTAPSPAASSVQAPQSPSQHASQLPLPESSFSAAASASAVPAPPLRPATWTAPCTIDRVLPQPIRSIALGQEPFVAVLSSEPWLNDGARWKPLELPPRLRAQPGQWERVQIYLGRDDKPRIMGARGQDQSFEQVYLRWRGGRWQRDRSEIGRLAGAPQAGLYGVLGHDDPEVVCKAGDACIIKRRSGWTTFAVDQELAQVFWAHGQAYRLTGSGMQKLQGASWIELPWSFEGKGQESGFWAEPDGRMWVSVASQNAIYQYAGGSWSKASSPVQEPGAMWGSGAHDIWVVGKDGAGHFDGTQWSRVQGFDEELTAVLGRNARDVWLGGPAGLVHCRAER